MDAALLARFAAIVGERNALTPDRADLTHYTHENRKLVIGKTPLVLRPGSTAEVAAIVKLAAETGFVDRYAEVATDWLPPPPGTGQPMFAHA